jgi:hypothetical protein
LWADRLSPLLSSTWTLGALVFLATWGGGLAAPAAWSLDDSTHIGFYLAAVQGLDFGTDLVFSYGPLGFLKTFLALYEWPARLATLYGAALHLALTLTLVYAARRSLPLPIAVTAALVAAALMRGDLAAVAVRVDAAVVVLAFIWCVIALDDRSPPWTGRLIILAGGPFAALEILAKPSTGGVVLALVAVTALAMEGGRRRNAATLAATFASPLAVLWLATGQGAGDAGRFLTGTWELAAGYSSGARLEWGTRNFDYLLAPAVIAAAFAIAALFTGGTPPLRRGAMLAMLALVAFTASKAGFVSHEEFHMATFYATLLGACLAVRAPPRREIRAGLALVVAAVAAAALTTTFEDYPMANPIENAREAGTTLADIALPGGLADRVDASRERMIGAYELDGGTLELLEGREVHVDPAEVGVVWAHELDWRPPPVFQPYAAWTEELDRRNAAALASEDGPERILRRDASPLGRYPGFESPAAMIAMLCNFEALATDGEWQVLGRIPDRCGDPRPLASAAAAHGEPIRVPEAPPGELVIARARGVQVAGAERLKAMLYRADARRIAFDDGPEYVLVPETAGSGLLLRAPAGADFPDGFALAPNPETVRIAREGGPADATVELDLYAMPVGSR